MPGSRRSPGEGNGNPLHYSCLENPTERGAGSLPQSIGSQRVGHNWVTKHAGVHAISITSLFLSNIHLYLGGKGSVTVMTANDQMTATKTIICVHTYTTSHIKRKQQSKYGKITIGQYKV